jgi:hypothetical protein
MWDETAGDIEVIWVNRETEYFSNGAGQDSLICPSGTKIRSAGPSSGRDRPTTPRDRFSFCS